MHCFALVPLIAFANMGINAASIHHDRHTPMPIAHMREMRQVHNADFSKHSVSSSSNSLTGDSEASDNHSTHKRNLLSLVLSGQNEAGKAYQKPAPKFESLAETLKDKSSQKIPSNSGALVVGSLSKLGKLSESTSFVVRADEDVAVDGVVTAPSDTFEEDEPELDADGAVAATPTNTFMAEAPKASFDVRDDEEVDANGVITAPSDIFEDDKPELDADGAVAATPTNTFMAEAPEASFDVRADEEVDANGDVTAPSDNFEDDEPEASFDDNKPELDTNSAVDAAPSDTFEGDEEAELSESGTVAATPTNTFEAEEPEASFDVRDDEEIVADGAVGAAPSETFNKFADKVTDESDSPPMVSNSTSSIVSRRSVLVNTPVQVPRDVTANAPLAVSPAAPALPTATPNAQLPTKREQFVSAVLNARQAPSAPAAPAAPAVPGIPALPVPVPAAPAVPAGRR